MVRPSLIPKSIISKHLFKQATIDNSSYYLKTNIIILMFITIFIMYLYLRYINKNNPKLY